MQPLNGPICQSPYLLNSFFFSIGFAHSQHQQLGDEKNHEQPGDAQPGVSTVFNVFKLHSIMKLSCCRLPILALKSYSNTCNVMCFCYVHGLCGQIFSHFCFSLLEHLQCRHVLLLCSWSVWTNNFHFLAFSNRITLFLCIENVLMESERGVLFLRRVFVDIVLMSVLERKRWRYLYGYLHVSLRIKFASTALLFWVINYLYINIRLCSLSKYFFPCLGFLKVRPFFLLFLFSICP